MLTRCSEIGARSVPEPRIESVHGLMHVVDHGFDEFFEIGSVFDAAIDDTHVDYYYFPPDLVGHSDPGTDWFIGVAVHDGFIDHPFFMIVEVDGGFWLNPIANSG